jgi:hypothetical protein
MKRPIWLSDAATRLGRRLGKSRFLDDVTEPLHEALVNDDISAVGDIEDWEGRKLRSDIRIESHVWSQMSDSEFADILSGSRHLVAQPRRDVARDEQCFINNVRLEADEFTKWLDGNLPPPLHEPTGTSTGKARAGRESQIKTHRGPSPAKRLATVREMMTEIESGKLSRQDLATMKQEALAARYEVCRTTAVKARDEALASIPETPTNSDK